MYRAHNKALTGNKKRRMLTRHQIIAINKARRRIDCPTSEVYDNHHHMLFGNGCGYKHTIYSWEGRIDNTVTLISDSICKWVNKLAHTHTQAIPGLTLESALTHMQKGMLKIQPYPVILLHLGTNNIWNDTPDTFRDKLIEVTTYIRKNSNVQRIGLSAILPRVRDLKYPDVEIRRRKFNTIMCKMCAGQTDMLYMRSWKCVTIANQTDRRCYARDLIHLNFEGIIRMKRYFRGASANLKDLNRPRAQPTVCFN
jgi:hypothetical protein